MNRYFFLFFLASLATFRSQRIVTSDTWYPTEKFREWLVIQRAKNEDRQSASVINSPQREKYRKRVKFWTEVIELFNCPWCFGFWCSGVCTLVLMFTVGIPLPLFWWAAISGAVGLMAAHDGS